MIRGAAALLLLSLCGCATVTPSHPDAFAFGVMGDTQYNEREEKAFLAMLARVDREDLAFVVHVGDIAGGWDCSDELYARRKREFDGSAHPFIFTPGDNEWTDCHRANNGSFNPLDRLAKIRELFFGHPGRTLGINAVPVTSQAARGYPENVRYTRGRVAFASVHIVGSNNSLAPWTGNTGPTPAQSAEVLGRTAAGIDHIRTTFAEARKEHDRSVVLLTQADMFDPTVANPAYADYFAFQPIVRAIAEEAGAFSGPVYLINGDSHVFNSDNPLSAGSKWLSFYSVQKPVTNLERVTVDGSTGVNNYLRVTIDPRNRKVLDWTRVPFGS